MPKDQTNDEQGITALTVNDERKGIGPISVGGQQYAVKQQVNVPVLKHETGQAVAVRIELPIRKEIQRRNEEVTLDSGEVVKGVKEGQISVVRVTELSSGHLFNLVLNSITASELERSYPENENGVPGYVGKSFLIKKMGVVAGKRYKDVQIVEIEPTDNQA